MKEKKKNKEEIEDWPRIGLPTIGDRADPLAPAAAVATPSPPAIVVLEAIVCSIDRLEETLEVFFKRDWRRNPLEKSSWRDQRIWLLESILED